MLVEDTYIVPRCPMYSDAQPAAITPTKLVAARRPLHSEMTESAMTGSPALLVPVANCSMKVGLAMMPPVKLYW